MKVLVTGGAGFIGSHINVILNCVRFEVKKIIYASSGGAVYGEPQYAPLFAYSIWINDPTKSGRPGRGERT